MDFKIKSQSIKSISFLKYANDDLYNSNNTTKKHKMQIKANLTVDRINQHKYIIDINIIMDAICVETLSTIYNLNIIYSCLFFSKEANKEKLERLLLIDAPTLVLPQIDIYIKAITDGSGYSAFSIADIDFEKLYRMNYKNV